MKSACRVVPETHICDVVRFNSPDTVERTARHLFATDPEMNRDRELFFEFDAMPQNLQEWWRDRAARHIVSAPYGNPQEPTHEPS